MGQVSLTICHNDKIVRMFMFECLLTKNGIKYSGYKKFLRMPLFSNEASFYQLLYFMFMISNLFAYTKVLLNNSKFNYVILELDEVRFYMFVSTSIITYMKHFRK